MEPGNLRHRITIERAVEEQDAAGQMRVTGWTPFAARIAAEVLPDRASKFFEAQQVQTTANAVIRIRYREGVIPNKMRAKHHIRDGDSPLVEYWDIEGALPYRGRFRELRLMCLKRDAEGFRRGEDLHNE